METYQFVASLAIAGKPISTNHMYGRRKARIFLTKPAQLWRSMVYAEVMTWKHQYQITLIPPLKIECAFVGMRANADVDNLLKLTIDGFALGVTIDDRQIHHVIATRAPISSTLTRGVILRIFDSHGGDV